MTNHDIFQIKEYRRQPWCFLYYLTAALGLFVLWLLGTACRPFLILCMWVRTRRLPRRITKEDLLASMNGFRDDAKQIVEKAFEACDNEQMDMSEAELQYQAVIFSGGANVSLHYMGQIYFLKKHRLFDSSTIIYGCSTGAPNAALGRLLADSDAEQSPPEALVEAAAAMLSAHLAFHRHIESAALMGPSYIPVIMQAVMEAFKQVFEKHVGNWSNYSEPKPSVPCRLQIILCRPFCVSEPLLIPTNFKNVDELCQVLLASQVWPMLHTGWPWMWLKESYIADGGFVRLQPLPEAKPQFLIKRSGGTDLKTEEKDVIEEIKSGYMAAYRLHKHQVQHETAPNRMESMVLQAERVGGLVGLGRSFFRRFFWSRHSHAE